MANKEPFTLNPLERQSPLWLRLRDYLDERIDALRNQNEGNLGEIDTAHLRGRIAQLKALRALGDEPNR